VTTSWEIVERSRPRLRGFVSDHPISAAALGGVWCLCGTCAPACAALYGSTSLRPLPYNSEHGLKFPILAIPAILAIFPSRRCRVRGFVFRSPDHQISRSPDLPRAAGFCFSDHGDHVAITAMWPLCGHPPVIPGKYRLSAFIPGNTSLKSVIVSLETAAFF